MFFIFGSPRSGTTLLAQCLNAHDEIIVPHETDFIVPLAFIFDRIQDPALGRELVSKLITGSAAYKNSIGAHLPPAEINEIINSCEYHPAAMLSAIYSRIASKAGKSMAGDKSPNDLLFIRMLIKTGAISPSMKVIHIVRDLRDVMVSLRKLNWTGDLDLYFPRFWASSNLYLHDWLKDSPSQYFLARYEDLVAEPAAMFKRICGFLGVDFQEKMLSPSNRSPIYRDMEHHANLFKPISTNRVCMYKDLDPETLKLYETHAREALLVFGYQLCT